MDKIILSLDLGITGAWWVSNHEYGEEFKKKSLADFEKMLRDLIEVYKPDVIVYPVPTFRMSVLKAHNRTIGVILLTAEKKGIKTLEVVDSNAKKMVIGKGNAKKSEIMAYYGEKSEHIADCRMFTDLYLIINN